MVRRILAAFVLGLLVVAAAAMVAQANRLHSPTGTALIDDAGD